MKALLFVTLFFLVSPFMSVKTSNAGCRVVDGTHYSKSKYDIIMFIIAKRGGNKQKVQEMVDQGRILSCNAASASVLGRDEEFVNVSLPEIGKAWIFRTSLRCD
ncbi:MAG: hypothetical protein P8017_04525 [Deltaproteobacteria bacterium]|jgi:hypothetical protein